jgi:thiol:disulfide interchange protein DsbD
MESDTAMFKNGCFLLALAFSTLFSGQSAQAQSFDELILEMNRDPMARIKDNQPLSAEQAFPFETQQRDGILSITFNIAPEYHLYKDKFSFRTNAEMGEVKWPTPVLIDDPYFGPVAAYEGILTLDIPIEKAIGGSSLVIVYQGCSPTFCYPPRSATINISSENSFEDDFSHGGMSFVSRAEVSGEDPLLAALMGGNTHNQESSNAEMSAFEFNECYIDASILERPQSTHIDLIEPAIVNTNDESEQSAPLADVEPKKESFTPDSVSKTVNDTDAVLTAAEQEGLTARAKALLLCLFLGIGLAFTPCVFPMYPILTSVVVGAQTQSKKRTFILALNYVIGMALVYAIVGVVVASFGLQFQQALQHPYSIGAICLLFLALSGSLFGFYNLQMPSWYQTKINTVSGEQRGGKALSCFLMGALSGLVASPCTTAPLTGLMLYVAMSGDIVSGFTLFFALALGMGIPLIIFALTGNKLLPKAGRWMDVVKHAMGFVLVGVALFFAARIMPSTVSTVATAAYIFAISAYTIVRIGINTPSGSLRTLQAAAMLLALSSSVFVGMTAFHAIHGDIKQASGNASSSSSHLEFSYVSTLDELNQAVLVAKQQGKPVMLDLYADWCSACKEYEMFVFSDARVVEELRDWVLIQADLTEFNEQNDQIQKHLDVIGLPTIVFFGGNGERLKDSRLSGYVNADTFLQHVRAIR